ncbi:MAG: DUF4860 domain-containing protein [Anaerovoracaceae bacterium]|jgi:hypothetical protein
MRRRWDIGSMVLLTFNILLLFTVVLCGFFTIIIGAQVYENISGRSDAVFRECTPFYYVANKVRQSDEGGMLEVVDYSDEKVLRLGQTISGAKYDTLIYLMDGKLMEMFVRRGNDLDISEGMIIMDTETIVFSREKQLLKVAGGKDNCQMFLFPRSEKAAGERH